MIEKIYKVLWIDDDPTDELRDEARDDFDIELVSKECYSEGLSWLKENAVSCDAVIVDVYCKTDMDESPNIESFQYNIQELNRLCVEGDKLIPWFVYTGGPSGHEMGYKFIDFALGTFTRRTWDDRRYYDKPKERQALFSKIKEEADRSKVTQLKIKYASAFNIDSSIDRELVDILTALESGDAGARNSSALRSVGVVMETVMGAFVRTGFLPVELNEGIKISQCASFLGQRDMQKLIPQYIQQNIFTCVFTGSEGGHNLPARRDVEMGSAPYLFRSLVYSLLSLLDWLSQQSHDELKVKCRKAFTDGLYASWSRARGYQKEGNNS